MINHRSGFTLIELLIVVAIIAVLSGVGFNYYQDSIQEARENVVRNNLKTVREAISRYFKDNLQYPTKLEALTGPYLRESVMEMLVYPLEASSAIKIEVPTAIASPQASQATQTEWIFYPLDGSNVREIRDIKIHYENRQMNW